MSLIGRMVKPSNKQPEMIGSSQELQAFLDSSNGLYSSAGVSVTPKTAMAVSALSSAVGLISEAIAQLPLQVFNRIEPRGKKAAIKTALWRVLMIKPNRYQDPFQFKEQMTFFLCLWGNAYALKLIGRRGELLELIPMHPSRVTPKQRANHVKYYEISQPDGTITSVEARAMFHIKDRGEDPVVGRPRILDAKEAIGLSIIAERFAAQLFGNSARPSGVIETDKILKLEQMDELAAHWEKTHGGVNALGTAVLDAGFKWKPLVMNNNDAQFLELRKFQLQELSRIYRIPLPLLNELDKATLNNAAHLTLVFLKYTLMPYACRWECAVNDQLIGDHQVKQFSQFDLTKFERADLPTRISKYTAGLRDGWMSQNDVMEEEGKPLIDDPKADEYTRADSIHGVEEKTKGTTEPTEGEQND